MTNTKPLTICLIPKQVTSESLVQLTTTLVDRKRYTTKLGKFISDAIMKDLKELQAPNNYQLFIVDLSGLQDAISSVIENSELQGVSAKNIYMTAIDRIGCFDFLFPTTSLSEVYLETRTFSEEHIVNLGLDSLNLLYAFNSEPVRFITPLSKLKLEFPRGFIVASSLTVKVSRDYEDFLKDNLTKITNMLSLAITSNIKGNLDIIVNTVNLLRTLNINNANIETIINNAALKRVRKDIVTARPPISDENILFKMINKLSIVHWEKLTDYYLRKVVGGHYFLGESRGSTAIVSAVGARLATREIPDGLIDAILEVPLGKITAMDVLTLCTLLLGKTSALGKLTRTKLLSDLRDTLILACNEDILTEQVATLNKLIDSDVTPSGRVPRTDTFVESRVASRGTDPSQRFNKEDFMEALSYLEQDIKHLREVMNGDASTVAQDRAINQLRSSCEVVGGYMYRNR